MEFPLALDAALRDRRTAFLDTEVWIGNRALQDVQDLKSDFDEWLGLLFLRYSTSVQQPDGSAVKGWDALSLAAITGYVEAELRQRLGSLAETYSGRLAEEMVSGLGEGYDRALWELAIAGVDIDAARPMTPDDWITWVAETGFDGVTADDRAQRWIDAFSSKAAQQLRGSVIQGDSLAGTMLWASMLTTGLGYQLATLAQNELHRSWSIGSAAARGQFPEIPEVWVTRLYFDPSDRRVCPICLKKHMTITRDQPIDDSHPGCRCVKVPWTGKDGVEITSFAAFREVLQSKQGAS